MEISPKRFSQLSSEEQKNSTSTSTTAKANRKKANS
jgi:hypothetical protein